MAFGTISYTLDGMLLLILSQSAGWINNSAIMLNKAVFYAVASRVSWCGAGGGDINRDDHHHHTRLMYVIRNMMVNESVNSILLFYRLFFFSVPRKAIEIPYVTATIWQRAATIVELVHLDRVSGSQTCWYLNKNIYFFSFIFSQYSNPNK